MDCTSPRRVVATILALTIVLALPLALPASDSPAPGPLRVGIATVDITPEGSVWMQGFAARKKPSEGVYRPIQATCVLFDNTATRLAILAIDVCKISSDQRTQLLNAAEAAGIPRDHVLINVSHTHYGPTMSVKRNPDYMILFKKRTEPLFKMAAGDLAPAWLDYAVGSCTMAVNRRQMQPDGKPVLFRPEPRKEIDPDVPILRVLDGENKVRAVLFGYACHPTSVNVSKTHGFRIGTDYPGFARDWVEAAWPGATAVFLQGCGADIKPRYTNPNGRFGYVLLDPIQTVTELGHELGRAVVSAFVVPRSGVPEGRPEPSTDALAPPVALGGMVECLNHPDKDKPDEKPHPMFTGVWRIGDLYLFGQQGELGSQIGKRIKREFPDRRIWTNGYTHWGGGYIMEQSAYPEQGYEIRVSRLAPGADDRIVDTGRRMVGALSGKK